MKKSRINRYLILAFFTIVFGCIGASFYLWYTQPIIVVDPACTPIDTGARFWPALMEWLKALGPKLTILGDQIYLYLITMAHQTKLNLLWKYRHKITVLAIVVCVMVVVCLFLIALWASYAAGKRHGRKEQLSDDNRTTKRKH